MPSRTGSFKDVLWVLVLFGALAVIFRMTHGLGATTNLTDEVPWGLWKIFNMVAGVALSTSGFTIGFLVYVLKLERFRPLVKPAILIAFLGYGSSVTALFFDIGLPPGIGVLVGRQVGLLLVGRGAREKEAVVANDAGGKFAGIGHSVESLAEALHLNPLGQDIDQAARMTPGIEIGPFKNQILGAAWRVQNQEEQNYR